MENPLLRKASSEIKPSEDRYEFLGLIENPFPLEPSLSPGSGDPRLNGSIYSEDLTSDKENDLAKLLIPSHENVNPVSIAFLMDYATRRGRGIGKSAFLKHQCDKIVVDFGAKASESTEVLFAAHITPSPSCRKFWQFCRTIMEALIDQSVIAKAVWRLRGTSGIIPDEVLKDIGLAEDWERTIGDDQWLESRGVNIWWDLDRTVQQVIVNSGVPEDWARFFINSSTNKGGPTKTIPDISDYIWRKEGGQIIFHYLINFFIASGFTRGLLFIDEVEKIVYHQNMEERRIFVESLRYYMFDNSLSNARNKFYRLLLTIHPGIQELLLSHWKAAGLDRLAPLAEPDAQQSTIYLDPLNEAMAKPLVQVYLDHFRSDASAKGSIKPFTDQALVEALVKSGGVPGPTLRLLNRVLECAVEKKINIIEPDLVEHVYSSDKHLEPTDMPEEAPPSPQVDLTGD